MVQEYAVRTYDSSRICARQMNSRAPRMFLSTTDPSTSDWMWFRRGQRVDYVVQVFTEMTFTS